MAALSTPSSPGRFATAAFRDLASLRRRAFSWRMHEPSPSPHRTPPFSKRLLTSGAIALGLAVLAASVLTAAALIAAG